MQNDYHDEFEGQEGSEYHFSDDEVNYETEEVVPKPEEGAASVRTEKESIVNRLMNSKRVLISAGVFIALMLIVYRMVTPTTTEPPGDIVSAPPPSAPMQAQTTPPQVTQTAQSPQAVPQPAAPAPTTTAQTQALPQPIAAAPTSAAQPALPQTGTIGESAQANQVIAVYPQPSPTTGQQTTATMPTQQTTAPVNQTDYSMSAQNTLQNAAASTPMTTTSGQAINPAFIVTGASNVEEKIANVAANNERLIGQLQGQYAQQYNDFANQTRAIQEQMQTLSSRVAVIEGQLTQLIQALTKKNAATNQPSAQTAPRVSQAPDVKINYNVQAIIPGRAWLKSDSGETLTVAEGDAIKGVGRVSKIDPYDGIVELNTGTRTISLSYGESA